MSSADALRIAVHSYFVRLLDVGLCASLSGAEAGLSENNEQVHCQMSIVCTFDPCFSKHHSMTVDIYAWYVVGCICDLHRRSRNKTGQAVQKLLLLHLVESILLGLMHTWVHGDCHRSHIGCIVVLPQRHSPKGMP